MPPDQTTMLLRILLAAALGMIIGLERETHGRAAGLRSCMLVAMAGALIMSLAMYLESQFAAPANDSIVRLDVTRLPSYAIAGMGFLGAGAIIQGKRSARGVTTAAAMWTCTVVGLGTGAGMYLPVILVVFLTVAALALLPKTVRHLPHEQFVSLSLETSSQHAISDVRDLLQHYGVVILFAGRYRCLETDTINYTFSLKIQAGPRWGEMLTRMEEIPGIHCYSWQEADVP